MSDFRYQIIQNFGVLSVSDSGWTKELNLVSFNDQVPKYDIREWSPDRSKMSRGMRFEKAELLKLNELISELD